MRGHVFTVVALLLMLLSTVAAAFDPKLALGIVLVVFLAGIGLLFFRLKNL